MNVNLRYAIILFAGFIFQTAVVPFISIGKAKPDIVLIVIATFGFINGPFPGAINGFIGGLLQDLVTVGSLGLQAVSKVVIGFMSGQVERTFLGSSALIPMVVIAGISIVSQTIYVGLTFLAGERIEIIGALKTVVIPSAAYTAVLGFLMFPYITRFLSSSRRDKVFK